MAQIITMNGPRPQDYVQHFADQYNAQQQAEKAAQAQQQQADAEAEFRNRQLQQTGDYQQGMLKQGQDTLAQAKRQQQIQAVMEGAKRYMDVGDYEGAKKVIAAALQTDPSLGNDHVGSLIAGGVSPADMAKNNSWTMAANDTGRAAAGSADPNAVNLATKMTTGSFQPAEGFKQQQAADLQARVNSAPTPAGNNGLGNSPFARAVPNPTGNAVADFEARSTEALPTSANSQIAQTQVQTEGMRQKGETGRTAMSIQGQKDIEGMREAAAAKKMAAAGGSPDVVQNYLTAIRTTVAAGRDATPILKNIADKKVKQAVSEELSKPENSALYQAATIPPAARESIASIDPLIAQARKVQKAYASSKDQNGLLDRDTVDYLLYRAGKKPPDGSPVAEVANTQMLGIQAGARLLKGGSRAYPALKMAMQHAPDAAIDTRANIYDKSGKLISQLVNVHNSELGWDNQSGPPPIGALKAFPNGSMGRWDGTGWLAEP